MEICCAIRRYELNQHHLQRLLADTMFLSLNVTALLYCTFVTHHLICHRRTRGLPVLRKGFWSRWSAMLSIDCRVSMSSVSYVMRSTCWNLDSSRYILVTALYSSCSLSLSRDKKLVLYFFCCGFSIWWKFHYQKTFFLNISHFSGYFCCMMIM